MFPATIGSIHAMNGMNKAYKCIAMLTDTIKQKNHCMHGVGMCQTQHYPICV